MSDSKTANTTNVKNTPPQNPRVGSVGTLVYVRLFLAPSLRVFRD